LGAALVEKGKKYGARSGGQNASQFAATPSKSFVADFRHFNSYRIRA
jgi:hypothetical protein